MTKYAFVVFMLLPFSACVEEPSLETAEQYGTCECIVIDETTECPAECLDTVDDGTDESSEKGRNPRTGKEIDIAISTSSSFSVQK